MSAYLIPAAAAVVVAVIEAIAARERRRERADRAHRAAQEQAREELQILLVQSTRAAITLGEATALALERGHCNGEMKAALQYALDIKHKQRDFLAAQGIHGIYDNI